VHNGGEIVLGVDGTARASAVLPVLEKAVERGVESVVLIEKKRNHRLVNVVPIVWKIIPRKVKVVLMSHFYQLNIGTTSCIFS
jgi:hypothetical protein